MAPVEHDVDGDLATITMQNPELRNALTLEAAERIQEAIDAEIDSLCAVFETDDVSEGVNSFFERRTPEFEGK